MEGLIPSVYRAIVQYKNGKQGPIGSWFSESPSASYIRLPGDSGRFQTSDFQLFPSDYGYSAAPSSSSSSTSVAPSSTTTTQIIVSTGVQSPVYRFNSRRVVA